MYASLGQRLGQRLFEEVLGGDSLAPRLTLSKVAAVTMALAIHGCSVAWLAGGVLLIVLGWPTVVLVVLGVVVIAIAVLLRPRAPTVRGTTVQLQQVPSLQRFVSDVAERVGTKPPSDVLVGPAFNTAVFVRG